MRGSAGSPTGRVSRSDRGAAAVEAALVLPAVMLVFFVAVQLCLWAYTETVVQEAAARGESVASLLGSSATDGKSAALEVLRCCAPGLATQPLVEVEERAGGWVSVKVEAEAPSIVPFLHLAVSAQRLGPVEEFRGAT